MSTTYWAYTIINGLIPITLVKEDSAGDYIEFTDAGGRTYQYRKLLLDRIDDPDFPPSLQL